jgi:hypothetical protein
MISRGSPIVNAIKDVISFLFKVNPGVNYMGQRKRHDQNVPVRSAQ